MKDNIIVAYNPNGYLLFDYSIEIEQTLHEFCNSKENVNDWHYTIMDTNLFLDILKYGSVCKFITNLRIEKGGF